MSAVAYSVRTSVLSSSALARSQSYFNRKVPNAPFSRYRRPGCSRSPRRVFRSGGARSESAANLGGSRRSEWNPDFNDYRRPNHPSTGEQGCLCRIGSLTGFRNTVAQKACDKPPDEARDRGRCWTVPVHLGILAA